MKASRFWNFCPFFTWSDMANVRANGSGAEGRRRREAAPGSLEQKFRDRSNESWCRVGTPQCLARARDVSRGEVARAAPGFLSARVHAPLARGLRCPIPPRLARPERAVRLVRAPVPPPRLAGFVPARRERARGHARLERGASPGRGARRRPSALGCAPARFPDEGSVRQEGRVLRASRGSRGNHRRTDRVFLVAGRGRLRARAGSAVPPAGEAVADARGDLQAALRRSRGEVRALQVQAGGRVARLPSARVRNRRRRRDARGWFFAVRAKNAPAVCAKTEFTSVEISDALAATARRAVRDALDGEKHTRARTNKKSQNKTSRDSDVYSVVRGDAADRAAWGAADAAPCFVVALEVLDNLPHDKVVLGERQSRSTTEALESWFQTRVRFDPETNTHVEHHAQPLSDALAVRAMAASAAAVSAERNARSFARRARAAEEALFPPSPRSRTCPPGA